MKRRISLAAMHGIVLALFAVALGVWALWRWHRGGRGVEWRVVKTLA